MGVSVCPVALVAAPVEVVWALLTNPSSYSSWWNAETESVVPEGPAQAGQVVHATSPAFGRRWPLVTTVLSVDQSRRAVDLHTTLPLGIEVRNHIACVRASDATCRLTFG